MAHILAGPFTTTRPPTQPHHLQPSWPWGDKINSQGWGGGEGRRKQHGPSAASPTCRPQHLGLPEDAVRRVGVRLPRKLCLGSTLWGCVCVCGVGWGVSGQPSSGFRSSGAGPGDFQGMGWVKSWRDGGPGAHRGSLEAGELHSACSLLQGCVCL